MCVGFRSVGRGASAIVAQKGVDGVGRSLLTACFDSASGQYDAAGPTGTGGVVFGTHDDGWSYEEAASEGSKDRLRVRTSSAV